MDIAKNRLLKLIFIVNTVAVVYIVYRTYLPCSLPCICQGDKTDKDLVYIGDTRAKLDSLMDNNTADIAFNKFLSKLHYSCENYIRLGNTLDGGWNMCVAEPFMPQKPCLVYSFGINRDFSFDDAVASNFGCTVRSFDPSMHIRPHRRSQNVWFYNIGIGQSNEVNKRGWTLKTLHTLVTEFNESDAIIDYLKMDIEENEWTSLVTMLSEGTMPKVKQFGIEVHMAEVDAVSLFRKYTLLKRLEDFGFRRWFYAPNYYGMKRTKNGFRSCCYEMTYINVNYLKIKNGTSP